MTAIGRQNGNTPTARRGYGGRSVQSIVVDDTQLDAFSRAKVGAPYGLLDVKHTYTVNEGSFQSATNGAGASISYLPNESSVELTVGTASGEYAIRESFRPYGYVPGKGMGITMTGVMAAGKTNLVQRFGYFDASDGIYFELDGTTLYVVIRSSASGVVVESRTQQAEWNLDNLNNDVPAKNISGKHLDITKAQIFHIDFQWLGVGRVRFGLIIDGRPIYVHEVDNANSIDSVYMSRPDLPVRYEIRNTGVTASSSTMKQICCSVESNGGYRLPGDQHTISNGIAVRAVSTTRTPILAIRQASTFNGKDNKRFAELVSATMLSTSGNCFFEVVLVKAPTADTATWTAVTEGDSSLEYSTDITAVTGDEHRLMADFTAAGPATTSSSTTTLHAKEVDKHGYITRDINGVSYYFVIFATSFVGSVDVSAAIRVMEFD